MIISVKNRVVCVVQVFWGFSVCWFVLLVMEYKLYGRAACINQEFELHFAASTFGPSLRVVPECSLLIRFTVAMCRARIHRNRD